MPWARKEFSYQGQPMRRKKTQGGQNLSEIDHREKKEEMQRGDTD